MLTKYRIIQSIHPLSNSFNFKIWPRSLARSVVKVIYETNKQSIYTAFVSFRSHHSFLRHRQFIIRPWNCKVKVTPKIQSVNRLVLLTANVEKRTVNTVWIHVYAYIWSVSDKISSKKIPLTISEIYGNMILQNDYLFAISVYQSTKKGCIALYQRHFEIKTCALLYQLLKFDPICVSCPCRIGVQNRFILSTKIVIQ